MTDPTLAAAVAAARAYEALFVPALFGQWAPRVIEAASVTRGQRVLDVACGTGVLAREASLRTGPAGYVAGLDPAAGMLTVAKESAPLVDWRQGVAESLPFPDASFDAVVSQFGLMFMNRDQAIREMLRVLKPGGALVVAVWDALQNIPAYAVEVGLIERFGGTPAADAMRAPFALGDRNVLTGLFRRAGAASATTATLTGSARFPDIRTMVEADLRGWLPVVGVELAENQIATILEEAEDALSPYVTRDGRVTFDATAHIVTARR